MKDKNGHIVPESYVGLLYEDGVFVSVLKPGRHKLKTSVQR